MKKTTVSLALCLLCALFPMSAAAAGNDPSIAYASNQNIIIDGRAVAFQTYMLLEANGYGTNYVKLRDVAHVLNGTRAQFSVGYTAQTGITITTGAPYQDVGSEMDTPFAGADKSFTRQNTPLVINGAPVPLDTITLLDDSGGGYNYIKLRDLGQALGFFVDWDAAAGSVVLDTTRGHDAAPADTPSAMAGAMLNALNRDIGSQGSARLADVDGDGVKELIVLSSYAARLYDWNGGQLSGREIGILAGGQIGWWLCRDISTGAFVIEYNTEGAAYDNSTFFYPNRETHISRFHSDDGSSDFQVCYVDGREVTQAEYLAVKGQNRRLELLISDMDQGDLGLLTETRSELECLLAGKTARDISDEALLQIARRLEAQVSTMDINIMNGWPTECDYSDVILWDTDIECYRVIGYTSAADVLRAAEEIWYRYVSRSDPTFEQVFAPHILERYVARNGALYRHDMGMGDGGIVNVVDQLISRTADRAAFSGYSTYDGEERLSTFQVFLVYEDGVWKYRSTN